MSEHSTIPEEKEQGIFQKVQSSPSKNDVVFLDGNPVLVAQPITVIRALTSTRVLAPHNLDELKTHPSQPGQVEKLTVEDEKSVSSEKEDEMRFDDNDGDSPTEGVMETPLEEEQEPVNDDKTAFSSEARRSKLSFDEFLIATDTKVAPVEESLKPINDAGCSCKRVKEEPITDDDVEVISVKQPLKKVVKVEEKIPGVEDGEFNVPPGWLLMGRKVEIAISTAKGVRRIVDNEILHFYFPLPTYRNKSLSIVRVSTKRSGGVGRLPMEWAKTVVPLVQSGNVQVLGRCIAAPYNLQMMQEIMVLVSFYIHKSVFTECIDTSWRLEPNSNSNSSIYPLLQLFKMLEIKPSQKAEFSPEEIDPRKRLLNRSVDPDEVAALPMIKRRKGVETRKGVEQIPEQNESEQALSESTLNKLVGAAEIYDLEEKDAPMMLMCELKPYQKQALYWMSEIEKGNNVETEQILHPCWSAYNICEGRRIYVNIFTGEAVTKFPRATQMARGGILADAMGLGKTVMTISLILSNPGRGNSENDITNRSRNSLHKGGTLIVCPMALLGQWKDELETHSKEDSLSIFVHYGGGRTTQAELLAAHDVVLTTYNVLSGAFKNDGEDSIYNRVHWYRVVLDEAHTIKLKPTKARVPRLHLHCPHTAAGV